MYSTFLLSKFFEWKSWCSNRLVQQQSVVAPTASWMMMGSLVCGTPE